MIAGDVVAQTVKHLRVRLKGVDLAFITDQLCKDQSVFADMSTAIYRHHAGSEKSTKEVGDIAVRESLVEDNAEGGAGMSEPNGHATIERVEQLLIWVPPPMSPPTQAPP